MVSLKLKLLVILKLGSDAYGVCWSESSQTCEASDMACFSSCLKGGKGELSPNKSKLAVVIRTEYCNSFRIIPIQAI